MFVQPILEIVLCKMAKSIATLWRISGISVNIFAENLCMHSLYDHDLKSSNGNWLMGIRAIFLEKEC